MKIKFISVCIALMLFSVVSCATNGNSIIIDGEKIIPADGSQYTFRPDNSAHPILRANGQPAFEGYIGGKYIRVIAVGRPKATMKGKEQRRDNARAAAVMVAKYQALEKLNSKDTTMQDNGDSPVKVSGYSGMVKAGKVMCEFYDDEDTCAILFDITVPAK